MSLHRWRVAVLAAAGLCSVVRTSSVRAAPSSLPHRAFESTSQDRAQLKSRTAPTPPPRHTAREARAGSPSEQSKSAPWGRSSAVEWVRRAENRTARGQLLRAVSDYTQALSLDPSYAPAYLGLGRLRARLGDPEEAERTYQAALRYPGAVKAALFARAELRWKLFRRDQALLDLRAAAAHPPFDRSQWVLLADWYTEEANWVAALNVWRLLVADDPTSHAAHIRVLALTRLANTTDPGSHLEPEDGWVRRSLGRLSQMRH